MQVCHEVGLCRIHWHRYTQHLLYHQITSLVDILSPDTLALHAIRCIVNLRDCWLVIGLFHVASIVAISHCLHACLLCGFPAYISQPVVMKSDRSTASCMHICTPTRHSDIKGRFVEQELSSSWDGRPFGHNRHGPKRGGLLCPFPWGQLGPI